MKKCEKFQEMISAYIDGEVDDAATSNLFFHLGGCSECRSLLKEMLRLRSALQEIEQPVQKQPQESSFWKKRFAVPYPVAAVIALAVMLSGFLFFGKISGPPKIVERVETQYVYMTSFPPVYVFANSPGSIKSN